MNTIITISMLVFFNIAFFLLGGGSTDSTAVWIAYAFIHFAGLCQIFTPRLFNEREAAAAAVGASLRMFSLVYFVVMLLAGILIAFIAPDGWKITFLVLLFITLIYVSLFLAMFVSYRKKLFSK